MVVTCTFNDFKAINIDTSAIKFGGIVVYVKGAGDGITHAALLNTARLNVVFVLSNTPTQNNFLAEFPGAIKVDSIV